MGMWREKELIFTLSKKRNCSHHICHDQEREIGGDIQVLCLQVLKCPLWISLIYHLIIQPKFAYISVSFSIWICSSTGLFDLDIISSDGEYNPKGYLLRQQKAVCQISLWWSRSC